LPNRRILILSTGGTIAGNVQKSDALAAKQVQAEKGLKAILKDTLKDIELQWKVKVEIQAEEIADVDSSDILPYHWTKLAERIHARYEDFDGFIVTHGTNTMGYTCAALSFALPNLSKCVAVTGSQIPFGKPASDAAMNLDNAVRTVAYPWQPGITGVVCVFGSYIITGTRAKKESEFEIDAFRPFASAEIGRIGRIIAINDTNLARHISYLGKTAAPALTAPDLMVEANFDTRILSLTEYPGLSPDLLLRVFEEHTGADGAIRGVIFRAFGAGDASTHLIPCFEYLAERKVPVVVTTQAPNGNSNFLVNEPGLMLKEGKLAIPAFDMSIEACTAKLAWLLAKDDVPYNQMEFKVHEDLHGEITVVRERS
jgi:L-asparaginase